MKRYAIVVENAGSNLAAYVPDLPGCVATGETREEVERLIRESIALHLEGLAEDELPIPEPTSHVDYVEVEALSHATSAHPERQARPKKGVSVKRVKRWNAPAQALAYSYLSAPSVFGEGETTSRRWSKVRFFA